MKLKIKKGDEVMVMIGSGAGARGKVLRTLPAKGRVVVEGVNIKKRHERPRKQGEKGQMVEAAYPLAISNVLLWCTKCGRGVRAGYTISGDKKTRICKRCGNIL